MAIGHRQHLHLQFCSNFGGPPITHLACDSPSEFMSQSFPVWNQVREWPTSRALQSVSTASGNCTSTPRQPRIQRFRKTGVLDGQKILHGVVCVFCLMFFFFLHLNLFIPHQENLGPEVDWCWGVGCLGMWCWGMGLKKEVSENRCRRRCFAKKDIINACVWLHL